MSKPDYYNTSHEYDQEQGEMAEMERLERDYQEVRQGHAELMAQNKFLRGLNADLLAALKGNATTINHDGTLCWCQTATTRFERHRSYCERARAVVAKAENK